MAEALDEALLAQVRESKPYKDAVEELVIRIEEGDPCAVTALLFLGTVIPPAELAKIPPKPIGKPQEVPPIKKAEVEKKHIKRTGKR